MEVITGIFSEAFWYIAPILVTLTTALAGLFNQGVIEKFVPEQHRAWLKQLVAWLIGAGLSVIAWAIKVITFGNPVWLGVVALCVVVGLSSNGIYDIQFIKNWIETWFKAPQLLLAKESIDSFVENVNTKSVEEKPLEVKAAKPRVRKVKAKTEETTEE